MNSFDRSVLRIIERFSYKFFVVIKNEDVKCTCLNHGTNQADPKCKKCLGTGYKIKIKEVEGASQDSNVPETVRPTSGFITARNYYIKSSEVELGLDDIIVDGDSVWSVYQLNDKTSFHGNQVYRKYATVPKKSDKSIFLKNFNEIVGR